MQQINNYANTQQIERASEREKTRSTRIRQPQKLTKKKNGDVISNLDHLPLSTRCLWRSSTERRFIIYLINFRTANRSGDWRTYDVLFSRSSFRWRTCSLRASECVRRNADTWLWWNDGMMKQEWHLFFLCCFRRDSFVTMAIIQRYAKFGHKFTTVHSHFGSRNEQKTNCRETRKKQKKKKKTKECETLTANSAINIHEWMN